MADFVHLHCHTEYSLLDGAIRLKDLCKKAIEYKMPAAAITDHGNLFGALIYYSMAKEYGIKPIIGCEVYVAKGKRTEKNARSVSDAGYHLVLLAKNREGYHNLAKLVSRGFTEGFHYKPRVDKDLLEEYSSGLIALSACLKGEVTYKLRNEGMDVGLATAREYMALFPGRFYIEIQANGLKEQYEANDKLIELAKELDLPLVATNDCHYLNADDAEAHDVLLCIQTNACVDDAKRMRFGSKELYFRPPAEMAAAFSHVPEALDNTVRIAEEINIELELGKHHFPVYTLPEGMSLEDEFRRMSREGLEQRLKNLPYKVDEAAYWQRYDKESDIICSKGFAGYFLIVQDFINWAKSQKIPVGPGRGSAAGSLAAFALRITNIDPMRYALLFERFLNVERISMPDIDVDFCERRRQEVIRYVTRKYGDDSVSQITTFGTMKAKAVIRDVGRAMGMSFSETDKIAKLVPEDLKMTIDKALEQEPELKTLASSDPKVAKLLDISKRLEGLSRHASTHAAGVVVSDKPMMEYLPLYKGKKGEVVTQYDMKRVEKVGLIKFDFLGLKTLTVIQDALDLIREGGVEPPNLDILPTDDEETLKMLARGQTDGVFQLESSGMRRVLVDMRPSCFEDLIALLALYRPGPLESGMVTDFVKRKHGLSPIEYPLPEVEPILKDTYGVILYQEQVMQIAQVLASYSLGEGDLLRRAMGKKNPEEMGKQRDRFMDGARKNNHPEDKSAYIFDLMEKFAGYGFNKSHSAAYALVTYHTAYLKRHHPVEFMAALISSELDNSDKVLKYIANCRDIGIKVQPPDVNVSHRNFWVQNGEIVFGLAGIKNVGDEAIREIVDQRNESGPFTSLLDLCSRVNLRKVTKRVLENLIKSGACDNLGDCTRNAYMAGIDRVVAMAQKRAKEKQDGQLSLMGICGGGGESACQTGLGIACEEASLPEWPDDQKMRFEKESLGFFLTSHPLFPFRDDVQRLNLNTLEECAEYRPGAEVKVAVLVTGVKEHFTKKGDKMAFCQIEDLTCSGEVTMFPETYLQAKPLLSDDQPLLLLAKVSDYEGAQQEEGTKQAKLLAHEVKLLSEVQAQSDASYFLRVDAKRLENGGIAGLKEVLRRFPGPAPVILNFVVGGAECKFRCGDHFKIWPNPELKKALDEWAAGPA